MPRFRTIEVSDPLYECDNLRHVTVKSPALKGRGDITLFVPPDISSHQKVPIAILLHGVYGSHWAWALKGSAHWTTLELIDSETIRPIVLAMPSDGLSGDGSGYVRQLNADYEQWIMSDVVDCAREVVPQTDGGELFLSGLSMGGFGALRLGGKFSNRVAGISAHSSITDIDQLPQFIEEPLSNFGPLDEGAKSCAFWLTKPAFKTPLRFDCGTEDPLIEHNRKLHAQLLEANVKHEYVEFSGGHSWEYWREHLVDTLKFFERCRTK